MAEGVSSYRRAARRGLTLGKFLPPHKGHRHLIDVARHFVDELTILVCSVAAEPIPGTLRYDWMRAMFPDCRVVHVTDEVPQAPGESAAFWPIWIDLLRREEPRGFDVFFSSEKYGDEVARRLGVRHVPVDPLREMFPISGTALRADPLGNWRFIPREVRPHYVKRVCLFGPESTGKTTLTRRLAEYFGTSHAPEFARTWLDWTASPCTMADLEVIVAGQCAAEDAAALEAERILFCDTDPLLTGVWSEMLFGNLPDWLRTAGRRRIYDLYLLLGVDAPWTDDGTRYFPDPRVRADFYERCTAALERERRPFLRLDGDWDERFTTAVAALQARFGVTGRP